jgi:hypothetical protein
MTLSRYSPFVIEQLPLASRGGTGGGTLAPGASLLKLSVHNRFDFTNLSELSISWRSLDNEGSSDDTVASGGVGHAQGAPHTRGCPLVLHGLTSRTRRIELNVTSPRGYLVNTWHIGGAPAAAAPISKLPSSPVTDGGGVTVTPHADGSLTVSASGSVTWTVSAAGSVSAKAGAGGAQIVDAGPTLMVLAIAPNDFTQLTEQNDRSYGPWTDTLSGWAASERPSFQMVGGRAVVTIKGQYVAQAGGEFTLTFDAGGGMAVAFAFEWQGAATNPRQIGVVFDLPSGIEWLSWQRQGQFSYYSPDDIGVSNLRCVCVHTGAYPPPSTGPPFCCTEPGTAPNFCCSATSEWTCDRSPAHRILDSLAMLVDIALQMHGARTAPQCE